jgi:hypothetical protein
VHKRLARLSCLLALLASAAVALGAPRREPPLLFGGAPTKARAKPTLDPALPTGSRIGGLEPRPQVYASLCSLERPLCVHAAEGVSPQALSDALTAFDSAYAALFSALGLPKPDIDSGAGGSEAIDLYLAPNAGAFRSIQEPQSLAAFDRSAVYCLTNATTGTLLERAATLCLGEALASRLDAGEPPELRSGFALALWWLIGTPTAVDVQLLDDVQRHPHAGMVREHWAPSAAAFALLLEQLETTRSAAAPGIMASALFSAAASRTAPGRLRFDNEPDVFDVLRHSLEDQPARMADLLIDHALRRALMGDRDDGTRLPNLAFAGSFGRAHYDWVIPFSTLPRRVLAGHPIEPLGIELIWLELDEVPIGAVLGFRAEWEPPYSFQWRLLLLDAEGRELQRVDVPYQERASSGEARVQRLQGAKAVVIAGVNLEGVELAHPFDPDVRPFEPSSCTVYLARM